MITIGSHHVGICWNYLPPSDIRLENYSIFSRGNPQKMSFVTLTGWGVDQRNMFGSRFPINNLQSQIDGFAARPFRHTLRFRFSFAMLETRKRGQEVLDVDCVGDVSE